MATVAPSLLTAEQYFAIADSNQPSELVRGEIVMMSPAAGRHGQVCNEIAWRLTSFVKRHDLGHVVTNDAGTITARDPDTVRGPDVAFYSYAKMPKGPLPQTFLPPPDVAIEVRSPSDRSADVLEKVAEYLRAGVGVVVLVDPETESATLHYPKQPSVTLAKRQKLTLPPPLDGFSVRVKRFFEC